MAKIPLYRLNSGVSNYAAKFPDDFHIVAMADLDDKLAASDIITSRHWSRHAGSSSLTEYAIAYDKQPNGRYKSVFMHNVVWVSINGPVPKGMTVDHANRNGCDNRLDNLRLATKSQQNYNIKRRIGGTCGYRGVQHRTDRKRPNPYRASISDKNKRWLLLGYYSSETEGGFAFNVAAQHVHGEFAVPNHIPDGEISSERQDEIRVDVERRLRSAKMIDACKPLTSAGFKAVITDDFLKTLIQLSENHPPVDHVELRDFIRWCLRKAGREEESYEFGFKRDQKSA